MLKCLLVFSLSLKFLRLWITIGHLYMQKISKRNIPEMYANEKGKFAYAIDNKI